jgi:predicted ArsR family transcriptional regulator
MDRRLPQGERAERHRLLGDARRLAIVEALGEGPREIPELARLLGIHPTTVRAHLERLLEAGVLEEEAGVPAGRGRPSRRYRLRQPLLAGDPEVQLFVGSLVSLLREAFGDRATSAAQEEGLRRGLQLGKTVRHVSFEDAVREVVKTLTRLSFDPTRAQLERENTVAIDVRHCPFGVEPDDPDGAIVCAFHAGLVQGLAESMSGQPVDVQLLPFVAPGRCQVQLSLDSDCTAPLQRGVSTEDPEVEKKATRKRNS